ncbi:hypothetical protein NSB04_20390, partial [Blautia pseudococcoides]|nr:hypothetical protein [Blautia pseudococcoides]
LSRRSCQTLPVLYFCTIILPVPSDCDIKVTKQLVECGNLMRIPVEDHVIVGDGSYYSFRENGLVLPSTESIGIVSEQGINYRADRTGRR